MPLDRSASTALSTWSLYISRTGKYQRWLGLINVLLLLVSLTMVFAGVVFKFNYQMDKLGFIVAYFTLLPYSLMVVGSILFIVAFTGFVVASAETRRALFTYAVLMAIICLAHIGTVFVLMECRTFVVRREIYQAPTPDIIQDYYSNPGARAQWDEMHQRLRCCGALDFKDHSTYPAKATCVPASCCVNYDSSTGRYCFDKQKSLNDDCEQGRIINIWDKIYLQGCLSILQSTYDKELKTQMLFFAIFNVFGIILEVVSAALASAYVGQLSRRNKKFNVNNQRSDASTLPAQGDIPLQ